MSAQGIRIEDEWIEAVRNWSEPKSVQDIQVFIGFANFYQRFIEGFSRVVAPLTLMLKTTESFGSAPSVLKAEDGVVGGGGDRADETAKNLSKVRNLSKSKISSKSKKSKNDKSEIPTCTNIGVTGEPTFLNPGAGETFNQLRQAFTKALILQHFDPECHIRIETDVSGYAIGGVLSQLTPDQVTSSFELNLAKFKVLTKPNLNQWYPIAYFFRKIIPVETRYKTQDAELLAIVKAFKTWRHYLEGCKHEVLVLTDHNNLRWFIDMKSLSSRQVRWAQELSRYHFRIDYCQSKANKAADALSRFLQQSQAKEDKLRAENTRILHKLQSLLTNASLLGLSTSTKLLPLHWVLICGTHVLLQLRQFWDTFQTELAVEHLYRASIGGIRLWLVELQESDEEARKIKAIGELQEGWQDSDGVLHHQGLPFVPEIIWTELISCHHNDPLARHFDIDKTKKLIGWKYY